MTMPSSPPPLPPRPSTDTISLQASASPYLQPHPNTLLHSSDPRTSSTQSLVPSLSESTVAKRRLLVIYIHGFYGNDQSFRSFPAHVHALLKELLAETHVIHSKIYPRYKTYKAIEVARDNFSKWLEPHEGDDTDVVLVGHSMGGLLAAEVILMPNRSPYKQQPYKHRILGTIALDSPFLGMHPGIVVSGIASLFQPSPKLEDQQQQQQQDNQSLHSLGSESSVSFERLPSIDSQIDLVDSETSSQRPTRQPTDPYFDPPFHNDAPFREQPFVKRLINFTAKHRREGLLNAVGKHISSHLEFGGCLADYRGLNIRYNRLRALEDVDEIKAMTEGHPAGAYARVRFVNYYTLSPGRPKPVKVEDEESQEAIQDPRDSTELQLAELAIQDSQVTQSSVGNDEPSNLPEKMAEEEVEFDGNPAPQVALGSTDVKPSQDLHEAEEQHKDGTLEPHTDEDMHRISMQDIDPVPLTEAETQESLSQPATDDLDLPPIPDPPREPTLPEIDATLDKDARKQVEKEIKRLQKAYSQAVKDRAKAIQEREKLVEKRRKKAAKEAEKQAKDAEKLRLKQEKEQEMRAREEAPITQVTSNSTLSDGETERTDGKDKVENGGKPKKLRKFCALPSKREGCRDPTWVDVYMDGMDEVGAHCGLFLSGPHYDKLVGDVGSRIAGWVEDDLTKRAILEAE